MAAVVKHGTGKRVKQSGARGLVERLLAGPASGCNSFTVRTLFLEPDGRTAAVRHSAAVFYHVVEGKIVLSQDCGELDILETGDSAIVQEREKHTLMNLSKTKCSVLKVVPQ